jgi:hypothetical protein
VAGSTGVGPVAKAGKFSVVATIAPAGTVARAVQQDVPVDEVEVAGVKIPVITSSYGEPIGLPAPEEGVICVVSVLTAQAAKAAGRSTSDLLITSDPVRSADGKIIGCRKFAVL